MTWSPFTFPDLFLWNLLNLFIKRTIEVAFTRNSLFPAIHSRQIRALFDVPRNAHSRLIGCLWQLHPSHSYVGLVLIHFNKNILELM